MSSLSLLLLFSASPFFSLLPLVQGLPLKVLLPDVTVTSLAAPLGSLAAGGGREERSPAGRALGAAEPLALVAAAADDAAADDAPAPAVDLFLSFAFCFFFCFLLFLVA